MWRAEMALSYGAAMSDAVLLHVDEDGFFCLVAPDVYQGFVDEDWELEQLMTPSWGRCARDPCSSPIPARTTRTRP